MAAASGTAVLVGAPSVGAQSPAAPPAEARALRQRPLPPPPPPSDAATGAGFRSRFVLETGRAPVRPPRLELVRFQAHGEYQLRYTRLDDIPLTPLASAPDTDMLGQTDRLNHWLRLTPTLSVHRNFRIVGQIDLPRGLIAGAETTGVSSTRDAYDAVMPIGIAPRWLFLEWTSEAGRFRAGQQPAHWGMGLVENDGNHPSLFGDYQRGTIVERLEFTLTPFGRQTPLKVRVAGDVVFEDRVARLANGEVAARAVGSIAYDDPNAGMIGVYGAFRRQEQDARTPEGTSYAGDLTWGLLDSAGRFDAKVPGGRGHVFGSYEIAYQFGSTNVFAATDLDNGEKRERIAGLGAAAELGWVLTRGEGADRWGRVVTALQWGWMSADADATDGTHRRFTVAADHNVGLLLFDEVLKWKTARAADGLAAAPLPRVPSHGGLFGATYLYPTFVFRPAPVLDLRLGAVFAQTTDAFVDPSTDVGSGTPTNYDGGSPGARELGVELDGGIEYRHLLDYGIRLQLGAQAGVLVPGAAFADASGRDPGALGIAVARFGLQY